MCVNSLLLCAVWTWHSSQVVKQLETDKKTLEAKYQGERTEWSVKESAYKSREEEVTVQKQALEKKLSVRMISVLPLCLYAARWRSTLLS